MTVRMAILNNASFHLNFIDILEPSQVRWVTTINPNFMIFDSF